MFVLDAQIIICREDNTDFLSLGFIQTDTSLVSALGGALADFAQEIGLASDEPNLEAAASIDTLNLSRFQNGILASKAIRVGDHSPIILIAIKGFEGEDKCLDFIALYATELARVIVTTFENEYTAIGLVPKIDQAYAQIAAVANQLYRKHSDKVKQLVKSVKPKLIKVLEGIWEDQSSFEEWSHEFVSQRLAHLSHKELLTILAQYLYIQGIKDDAFFPFLFAQSPNPFGEIIKILDNFLRKKSSVARKEITGEILKIIRQLNDSSRALSRREKGEIPDVELINESFLFEKVMVTKLEQLKTKVPELLSNMNQELYRKLFNKFPLKFVAMSKETVFDKKELESVVNKALARVLKEELADKSWISEKLTGIIQQFTVKYSPNDFLKRKNEIILSSYNRFVESIKKEHPFILIANPELKSLEQYIKKECTKTLEKFSTTLDEAVILYNSVGQIHSSVIQEKSSSIQDLMLLYFLQQVIHPYQFRKVPDIVYTLLTDCLAKSSYGRKYKPEELLQKSIQQFEHILAFTIPADTKKLVLKRAAKAKATTTRFENYENLSYFFKSFRASLEATTGRILQKIFGPEKFPLLPTTMSKMIQKIALDLQSLYVLTSILTRLSKRPNARELFSRKTVKFLSQQLKFSALLPTPFQLASEAFSAGRIKSVEQKKLSSLTKASLKRLHVTIPELKAEGILEDLLAKPFVMEYLWLNFSSQVLLKNFAKIKTAIENLEKQIRIKAGRTDAKEKFGTQLKALRNVNRWFSSVLAGGKLGRKIRPAELQQLFQDASKNIHKSLRYHPNKYSVLMDEQSLKSIVNISPIKGDFQDLIKIYTPLWVEHSQFIEEIIEKLFWSSFLKTNGSPLPYEALGKKITQALQAIPKKDSPKDKVTIIRTTLEEEIVPAFNKIVRTALSDAFSIFKEDRIVKFDERSKNWYISLGNVAIPKNILSPVFSSLPSVALKKLPDDKTEIRFLVTKYYSLKRVKEDQTIEEFIRKATYNDLNKKEIKALEFFNTLIERYIGSSAADTFYSYIRALAQIIITPQ